MPDSIVTDGILKDIREDIFKGDNVNIKQHAQALLDKGVQANDILQNGMITAMTIIGEKFRNGKLFIPEVLLSARAMNEALTVLEPHLADKGKNVSGKILICTVQGDMHDIGKNMVVIMLRGVGFEVKDIGINASVEQILKNVDEYQPDILGMSALLTTTMPEMKKVIDALKDAKLRDKVKVIVGGAPVNDKFARDIGSDGYAADSGGAVTLAKKLLKIT